MRTNLKILRVKNNLTQEEMANRIGCTRTTYSSIEKGERNGRQSFWVNLQKAFDIPDNELWGYIKNDDI